MRYRVSAAVGAALAVHVALALLITWSMDPLPLRALAVDAVADEALEPVDVTMADWSDDAVPIAPAMSTEPVQVVPGPADLAAFGAGHPLPNADIDMPGHRAASLGGGAEGGSTAWTGRDDREDLRAQSWNDPDEYRLPRHATARDRASDESIARAPENAYDDRTETRRRSARRGDPAPALALAGPEPELAAAAAPARVTGAMDPTLRAAHVDPGAAATESPDDGATRDNVESAAASNETNPGAFEMTRPTAGGEAKGAGVAGVSRASGVSARGRGASSGTAALRAALSRSTVQSSTRARRQDPYFRKMYATLDRLIEFPKELALSMDQGEVIVRFTLHADGAVANVAIEKSSGYEKFDQQVTRAVETGGPFGKVPSAIIGSRSKITVRAPYAFRNPLIR
jgi:protein TonB